MSQSFFFFLLFDIQSCGLPDIEEFAYIEANGSALSSKKSGDSTFFAHCMHLEILIQIRPMLDHVLLFCID